MRRPLEKSIVASCVAVAKQAGWWVMKIHGGAYQLSGVPDLLVIRGGRAAWAEVKRPGEDPTKLQVHRMRELTGAGCHCGVVRSAGEMRAFLEMAGA